MLISSTGQTAFITTRSWLNQVAPCPLFPVNQNLQLATRPELLFRASNLATLGAVTEDMLDCSLLSSTGRGFTAWPLACFFSKVRDHRPASDMKQLLTIGSLMKTDKGNIYLLYKHPRNIFQLPIICREARFFKRQRPSVAFFRHIFSKIRCGSHLLFLDH